LAHAEGFMTGRDIIVIGGSTGGIPALFELIRGLGADLPAALFVVIHTSRDNPGALAGILDRKTELIVALAKDREPIRHGRIYVAPPDHHLLLKPGFVRVVRGPQENSFRPAVDPLFRTAAKAYGPRVVGVVLSGALDDGTHGLMLVKKHGGIAIVQSPEEAVVPNMPLSAVRNVEVNHILPAAEIGPHIERLVAEPLKEPFDMPRPEDIPPDVTESGPDNGKLADLQGPPSVFSCPECGGSLWEIQEGSLPRYRCHVGHGYSAESLVEEQSNGLEAALWTGLRALEDKAELCRRMADRARRGNLVEMAQLYDRREYDARWRASLIRKVLVNDEPARE
jgi:two-component system chemotaxis response regulator CheB